MVDERVCFGKEFVSGKSNSTTLPHRLSLKLTNQSVAAKYTDPHPWGAYLSINDPHLRGRVSVILPETD